MISSGEGVTYCVKPNASSSCLSQGCQKCETFQYILDNVNETINQQDNVTLLFMSGTHLVCGSEKLDQVSIKVPVLRMIGIGQNVTVTSSIQHCVHNSYSYGLLFITCQNIIVEQLIFSYCNMELKPSPVERNVERKMSLFLKSCVFQNSSIVIFNLNETVENCTFTHTIIRFYSTENATLSNCHFMDCRQFTIDSCNHVNIKGNSEFSTLAANSNNPLLEISSSNIVISGNVLFKNSTALYGGAMSLYMALLNITTGANVTFINNTAIAQGGAIYLSSSTLHIEAGVNLTFVNNIAHEKGGAIYIDPGASLASLATYHGTHQDQFNCFFNHSFNAPVNISFYNNKAEKGGDDVYGAAVSDCPNGVRICSGMSAVSSDPLLVCICDRNGRPQCDPLSNVTHEYNVFPGQTSTVPVVLVGVEYSRTTGVVYSYVDKSANVTLHLHDENGLVIEDPNHCTNFSYSLFSSYAPENVTVHLSIAHQDTQKLATALYDYLCDSTGHCYGFSLSIIQFTIIVRQCPPGFTLLNQRCNCYESGILFDDCEISNVTESGLFSWNTSTWVSIDNKGMLYNTHCPYDYCKVTRDTSDIKHNSDCPPAYCKPRGELIDLLSKPEYPCAFNRNGTLCGSCRENYSLAIGSSHCIQCHNNNNLALLIFFAAAGFILVFFITALNLTVSQGMVNGLIFYANIVWTYQSVFFSPYQEENSVLKYMKVFIAWVNLDFGIETCFISGLTAFWKTWLQFVFPFYIWVIAGLIIVASRYSTKLTNLLGNRAVPVLDTLFLLSYMKLVRIVVTVMEFSYLTYTDQNATVSVYSVVWSMDGTLLYCKQPHVYLFSAGLATLVVLCLPYTMLLLSMQWLRRLPRCKLTNWIMKFHPVYDAYFAPLKHKHQYWFGVLLLARVILLLAFVSTFAIPQYVNLLLLFTTGVTLISYIAVVQPYKNTAVLAFMTAFLMNLTLMTGFVIVSTLSDKPTLQTAAVGLSTSVAFLQFCVTVLYAVIIIIRDKCKHAEYCRGDIKQKERSTDGYDNFDCARSVDDEARPLLLDSARNTSTY